MILPAVNGTASPETIPKPALDCGEARASWILILGPQLFSHVCLAKYL